MQDRYGKDLIGAWDIIVEVALSLDTGAYADGDLLADTQEVANACFENSTCTLQSIRLLDISDQAEALDILILRSDEDMGTEGSTFAPTDAKASEILTAVSFSAGDYVDLANSQMAVKSLGDKGMGVKLAPSDNTTKSLYIAAVSRGTGTYAAAGIELLLGFMRD